MSENKVDEWTTTRKIALAVGLIVGVAALGVFIYFFVIKDSGSGNNGADSGAGSGTESSGISTGAIIGISVGVGALVAALSGFYYFNKRISTKVSSEKNENKPESKPSLKRSSKTSKKQSLISRKLSSRRFSNPSTVNDTIESFVEDLANEERKMSASTSSSVSQNNDDAQTVLSSKSSKNSVASSKPSVVVGERTKDVPQPNDKEKSFKDLLSRFGGKKKSRNDSLSTTSSSSSSESQSTTASEKQARKKKSVKTISFFPDTQSQTKSRDDDDDIFGDAESTISSDSEDVDLAGKRLSAVSKHKDPNFDFEQQVGIHQHSFKDLYQVFWRSKNVNKAMIDRLKTMTKTLTPTEDDAREFLLLDAYYRSRIEILGILANYYVENEAHYIKKRFKQCVRLRLRLFEEYKDFANAMSELLKNKVKEIEKKSLLKEGTPFELKYDFPPSDTQMVKATIMAEIDKVKKKDIDAINRKLTKVKELWKKFENDFGDSQREELAEEIEKAEKIIEPEAE